LLARPIGEVLVNALLGEGWRGIGFLRNPLTFRAATSGGFRQHPGLAQLVHDLAEAPLGALILMARPAASNCFSVIAQVRSWHLASFTAVHKTSTRSEVLRT
jgi:hypothetical protein